VAALLVVTSSLVAAPRHAGATPAFADVPAGSWYAAAAGWMRSTGLSTGYGGDATRFAPDVTVDRAQLATFLWRREGSPTAVRTNVFADVAGAAYHADAVQWLWDAGGTTGVSGDATRYAPGSDVDRAQAATILHRLDRGPVSVTSIFLNAGAGDPAHPSRTSVSPTTGPFRVGRTPGGGVKVEYLSDSWRTAFELVFGPAALPGPRDVLRPGPYPSASPRGTGSPLRGDLQATGPALNGACTRYRGEFRVLQAEFGPDGTVLRFAATFLRRCPTSPSAALRGTVYYNALPPFPVPADTDADGVVDTVDVCPALADPAQADADGDALGDPCDAQQEHVSVDLDNDAGDPIGAPLSQGPVTYRWLRTDADLATEASWNGPLGSPITSVNLNLADGASRWAFAVSDPQGIEVGTRYEVAVRPPGNAGTPGMSVRRDDLACINGLDGTFVVHELEMDGPTLRRFSADLVQQCVGWPGALRSSIRYFSTDP
jgi:hypothetical protein